MGEILTRPVLKSNYGLLTPFDASKDYIFKFLVIGGDQVTRNRLQIMTNSNNSVVYDKTIDSFEFEHALSLGILKNGTTYKAKLMTYSKQEESLWSDDIVFKCLSEAKITIPNIVNGVIGNQTYLFQGKYYQAEDSKLESYRFYLYDERKNIISNSDEILGDKLSFEFTGLENNKTYYIELKTLSVDGLVGTSKLIEFKAFYVQPKIRHVMKLENIYDEGSIRATAKVTRVLGHIDKQPISYENNEYINLKTGSIYFDIDNGFSIEKDFTLQIWGKDFTNGEAFISIYSKQGIIKLIRRHNRIYLVKEVDGINWYQLYSEEVNELSGYNDIYIWVRQKDCLFDLYVSTI